MPCRREVSSIGDSISVDETWTGRPYPGPGLIWASRAGYRSRCIATSLPVKRSDRITRLPLSLARQFMIVQLLIDRWRRSFVNHGSIASRIRTVSWTSLKRDEPGPARPGPAMDRWMDGWMAIDDKMIVRQLMCVWIEQFIYLDN